MSTATMSRPTTSPAPTAAPSSEQVTGRDKAVAALAIGTASAVTLGIFGWAVWVASQISIPI
ncbi:MAG: hypothetical protein RL347_346 [Actinomycetota bacterium]